MIIGECIFAAYAGVFQTGIGMSFGVNVRVVWEFGRPFLYTCFLKNFAMSKVYIYVMYCNIDVACWLLHCFGEDYLCVSKSGLYVLVPSFLFGLRIIHLSVLSSDGILVSRIFSFALAQL